MHEMNKPFTKADADAARARIAGLLALKQADKKLPWYDSLWRCQFDAALHVINCVRPSMRAEFIAAFERLRTRPDFQLRKLQRVFDDEIMNLIRETIRTLPPDRLEHHELENFGRLVVHNHEVFTRLQRTIVPLASELAGEPLEPAYNFLSLYSELGICEPHVDAPSAKWTLDLCIDQSDIWPIHFSQVVPWPGEMPGGPEGWQDRIKKSAELKFASCSLEPGEAVWFAGSSQWHYRDRIPRRSASEYCNLLFFHFIPEGMARIVNPRNWSDLFDMPELSVVVATLDPA